MIASDVRQKVYNLIQAMQVEIYLIRNGTPNLVLTVRRDSKESNQQAQEYGRMTIDTKESGMKMRGKAEECAYMRRMAGVKVCACVFGRCVLRIHAA